MKRIIRKLAASELSDEYLKGWADGVNQQLYEPESAEHGYVTESEYWGEY